MAVGGSKEGSYLRLMKFVSLNSRLERNKEEEKVGARGLGGDTRFSTGSVSFPKKYVTTIPVTAAPDAAMIATC